MPVNVSRRGPSRPAAWAALAAAIAVLGAAPRARADAYEATLTRAIAAKERALDVNEPARWEEALRLFQDADAIRSTRETKYELGYAAERLNREDLAVEAYEAAIDLGLGGAPRAKAKTFIQRHVQGMARLTVRGTRPGRIRVAGIERGRLPLGRPLVLFAEETALELVDPDGRVTSYSLALARGRTDVLDLDAAPVVATVPSVVPAAAAAEPPAAPPAAEGAAAQPLPAVAPPAAPVAVAPSPASPPAPPAAPPTVVSGGGHPGAWLIVTGLVVAAAGGVMVAVSNNQLQDLRTDLVKRCNIPDGPDACTQAKMNEQGAATTDVDGIASWKAVRIGAWVGVGVGAAVAGAGVIIGLLGNSREGVASGGAPRDGALAARWIPTPVVGTTQVGLAWNGRF
jgi:hypothetical protein